MARRFAAIWFSHLTTDWMVIRKPELKAVPFVFSLPDRGRMSVTAVSEAAAAEGIAPGMGAADAKAICTGLQVFDDKTERAAKLLEGLGEWCIRYSPIVATDLPDGLILDITGCTHLWGTEQDYLKDLVSRLKGKGYKTRAAIADTIGAAWGVSHFGRQQITIIDTSAHISALLPLPPAALRLEEPVLQRLKKLGFYQIKDFIKISRSALRRRFGEAFLLRLSQAMGQEEEVIKPLQIAVPFQERLPCLEPIRTKKGIEIAIRRLLEALCQRLCKEGKGLRTAKLTGYRIDGRVEQVEIGTNKAANQTEHLFKLFELKIASITPALGIELFVLEAPEVEDSEPVQEALWAGSPGLDDQELTELLDRLAGKLGAKSIHRYLPDKHFWPERSIRHEKSLQAKPVVSWQTSKPRPVQLLPRPEPVFVAAPIPDYPPIVFRYKDKVHAIKKTDGPERIEREWWMDEGEHRDYYIVEDEDGQRFWLFRSGHYQSNQSHQWFLHGFFA